MSNKKKTPKKKRIPRKIIIDPKTKEPMIQFGKLVTLEEMEKFFEIQYGVIHSEDYGTISTADGKYSYTVDTSDEEGRKIFAKTCYLLRKAGYEVYFGAVPRSAVNREDFGKI